MDYQGWFHLTVILDRRLVLTITRRSTNEQKEGSICHNHGHTITRRFIIQKKCSVLSRNSLQKKIYQFHMVLIDVQLY